MMINFNDSVYTVASWRNKSYNYPLHYFKERSDAINYVKKLISEGKTDKIKVVFAKGQGEDFDIFRSIWEDGKWTVCNESISQTLNLD